MMFAPWRVGDMSNGRIDIPPWTLPRPTRILSDTHLPQAKRISSFRTISTLTSQRHSTKPLLPLRRADWLSSGNTPKHGSSLVIDGNICSHTRGQGRLIEPGRSSQKYSSDWCCAAVRSSAVVGGQRLDAHAALSCQQSAKSSSGGLARSASPRHRLRRPGSVLEDRLKCADPSYPPGRFEPPLHQSRR